MKKKILCSLLALCALLIGCGNDIEQRSLENGIVETESTEIGWNQDEEDDLSEDFSESEDQLIDFRLVDGNLYDKVKQNFEYEGYDSITLYKSIDDYFSAYANGGWGIIPEYYDDYNNDGEKDIIYISADSPMCVYYAYKDDTEASVHQIGLLKSHNFFYTYDYDEMYYYIVQKDDNFYVVREAQREYCVDENGKDEVLSIEKKENYYYEWNIEICNLTESITEQKYITEEEIQCVEYFENNKLTNCALKIRNKGSDEWNYLYSNYDESHGENNKYIESTRKLKNVLDKYIVEYRNTKNVIPLIAYNICPVQRNVRMQKGEREADRIEDVSIIKIAYNNFEHFVSDLNYGNWAELQEEIQQTGEESDWVDQSVLKTNIAIDRIKSEDQKIVMETTDNNTVEMYANSDGNIERVSYLNIIDPGSNALITVDFYFENNEIIDFDLVVKVDEDELPEGREIIQYYDQIYGRYYVKNGYVYRTTDNFSFNGNHDTNMPISDIVETEWWQEICQDLNTRMPNALTEDVNFNAEGTGYCGLWSNYDDVCLAEAMDLNFESEDLIGDVSIVLGGRVEGDGTYYIYEDGSFSCDILLKQVYNNATAQWEAMNEPIQLKGTMVDNNNIECVLQYVGSDETYSYSLKWTTR